MVDKYLGTYNPATGLVLEKRVSTSIYNHNANYDIDMDINGWRMLTNVIYESNGTTISETCTYNDNADNLIRTKTVENETNVPAGNEFYGKKVEYRYYDEKFYTDGTGTWWGRSETIVNITDNYYYYFQEYQAPDSDVKKIVKKFRYSDNWQSEGILYGFRARDNAHVEMKKVAWQEAKPEYSEPAGYYTWWFLYDTTWQLSPGFCVEYDWIIELTPSGKYHLKDIDWGYYKTYNSYAELLEDARNPYNPPDYELDQTALLGAAPLGAGLAEEPPEMLMGAQKEPDSFIQLEVDARAALESQLNQTYLPDQGYSIVPDLGDQSKQESLLNQ